ncbi:hypothetical protein TRIATDRAFT_88346 [Trichoderma atroviride IMI 206040]|uniref:Uncharacterized protein n=1 Tax=Hypocrea atroviridis (strain ATCC 20476 / IMI 206040) TaxID=452589 RepID=G9NXB4_HYPAI|nr:uncharacterized protein TRIATDRAFT_88346 [Trichoderma atroviride IMI 206040]EHK44725.1 hypothetical protein TRIATDRAFT_88346 [Trichoderma atroviride IMI 206040]
MVSGSVLSPFKYAKRLEIWLKSIERRISILQSPSNVVHIQASQYIFDNAVLCLIDEHLRIQKGAREDEKRQRCMLSYTLCIKFMADNVDIAELSQISNENLPAQMENDRLSSSSNNLSLGQQRVEKQSTHHSEHGLPRFLNSEYQKVDMSFIAKNRRLFSVWELWNLEKFVSDTIFCNWMTSSESKAHILNYGWIHPSPISGILSPVSIASASLASLLNNRDQFICGVWFCSRHVKLGNDGVGVMLASFIDQICHQYSFDFDHLQHNGANEACLENRGNEELFNFLYALIKKLPSDITLVLLMDEINIFYRNKKFKDGPYIGDKLVKLVTDESLSTTVKLFFTSTNNIRG